jgi:hypothetical protein
VGFVFFTDKLGGSMKKISVKNVMGIFAGALIGFALVTASGGFAKASEAITAIVGDEPLGLNEEGENQSPAGVQNNFETGPGPGTPSSYTYSQLYVTPDGETHWQDVTLPFTFISGAFAVGVSQNQPVTTWRFTSFGPHWRITDRDNMVFHRASGLRFINVLQGVFWVMASDGETRRFASGDIFELLDGPASGATKGHIAWTGGEPVMTLFINHN